MSTIHIHLLSLHHSLIYTTVEIYFLFCKINYGCRITGANYTVIIVIWIISPNSSFTQDFKNRILSRSKLQVQKLQTKKKLKGTKMPTKTEVLHKKTLYLLSCFLNTPLGSMALLVFKEHLSVFERLAQHFLWRVSI